ncbi:DNA cytosine methyltransferase [Myxococcota bacterium]|nr:DNA cytosine methyltransferase [Myxococcota bacterium]
MSARPLVVSLFSGAGGLDYGLEAAGFETSVCIERDPTCCRTLTRNRPAWQVLEADIFEVSSDRIAAFAGVQRGELPLLAGGPPCQPFSKAGYWHRGDALRLADPRAATLTAYLRVLEDLLPRAFLLENVEGMAFSGKSEGLQLVEAGAAAIGERTGAKYSLSAQVLDAADFGAPQARRRLFVVGRRDGPAFEFPEPTHGPERGERHRTAWDALADLDDIEHQGLEVRGRWGALLPSIPEGQNYLWHTERGGGSPLFGWRTRYWALLLKLAKARPSWTLQAQPGPATGPFHWKNRRLSPRELMRLQTFPDDVELAGDLMAAHRQVGNAVCSVVAERLGREIARQVLEVANDSVPLRLVPQARPDVPAAERVEPIADRYLPLAGVHAAHPGTGLGPGAQRTAAVQAAESSRRLTKGTSAGSAAGRRATRSGRARTHDGPE